MRLFLWDIDGTLLLTGGAGMAAMTRAFEACHGIPDGFRHARFGGRTDPSLYREALQRHGLAVPDFAGSLAAFEAAYIRELPATLAAATGHVLPGVRAVVAQLASRPDVAQGVATGNFRRGAELKLAHYGVTAHLAGGGYGSDAEDRSELVAIGARRVSAGRGWRWPAAGTVVIGDAVPDVAAARANGMACLAVATGGTAAADLVTAGADVVLPDLAAVDEVVDTLLALAEHARSGRARR